MPVKDPYTGSILMHVLRLILQTPECTIYTISVFILGRKNLDLHLGSRVVSALAACARGPGFDPCRRRGKFVGPNTLPFMSFAGMT